MGATFADEEGTITSATAGQLRHRHHAALACVIEQYHDENGILLADAVLRRTSSISLVAWNR